MLRFLYTFVLFQMKEEDQTEQGLGKIDLNICELEHAGCNRQNRMEQTGTKWNGAILGV